VRVVNAGEHEATLSSPAKTTEKATAQTMAANARPSHPGEGRVSVAGKRTPMSAPTIRKTRVSSNAVT